MKICLVITGLTMGGAERQVCDLADRFAAMGHEVLLISLNKAPVVLPALQGVQVHHLHLKKTLSGLFFGVFALRRKIMAFGADVVHSHMVHANIMCRILRLITPMKTLICTAHNSNEGGVLRERLYRYTDRLATLSTNVSQEAVDTYIEKRISYPRRMIAVPNGIDIDRFKFSVSHRMGQREALGIDDDVFLFFSVGRLEEQKDYPNLLRALSRVHQRQPQRKLRLAIIGEGRLRGQLEDLARDEGVGEYVQFLGQQRNVHQWLSACDAYVLSSAWEGFGLVVAEAMLCERVVIATDCGGVKEVLGTHGILVPPQSTPALVQGMLEAMDFDEGARQDVGARARGHVVSHYSLESVARRWIALYERFC